jgi:hypothetical protein
MAVNKHHDFLKSIVTDVVKEMTTKKPMFKEEGNEPIEEADEETPAEVAAPSEKEAGMEIETPLDREKAKFEEDPVNYILAKYPSLAKTLTMLMSKEFKDYITGIYIVAPKPTTFRIVLHNGQSFTLAFMGKAYQAKVEGKKYFLLTIGEKERCILAIARLLETGSPITTKGPEVEESSKPAGEPTEAADEVPDETAAEEETES